MIAAKLPWPWPLELADVQVSAAVRLSGPAGTVLVAARRKVILAARARSARAVAMR